MSHAHDAAQALLRSCYELRITHDGTCVYAITAPRKFRILWDASMPAPKERETRRRKG